MNVWRLRVTHRGENVMRRCAGLFVILCAAASLSGCRPGAQACTPPHCPFTTQQAMALPDSQIYYPGSTVVARSGTDGSNNRNGEPEDAYVTTKLNVVATETEVAAWYKMTLAAAGWRHIETVVDASNHGFYAFTVSAPQAKYSESLYLDFRYVQPPASGTDYTSTFGVATP
jgi:hypothetical protein